MTDDSNKDFLELTWIIIFPFVPGDLLMSETGQTAYNRPAVSFSRMQFDQAYGCVKARYMEMEVLQWSRRVCQVCVARLDTLSSRR